MINRNYQKELQSIIKGLGNGSPTLLLHACCAPCSSYCLKYLSEYFKITVLFYNPNIFPPEEYRFRLSEIKRLISEMPFKNPVHFIEGNYDPEKYFEAVKGHENEKEGGDRCKICFRMRLSEAAKYAKEGNFDYFTTTLTISPLKNADILNATGEEIACILGTKWLPSDFKKNDGYKESILLSKEYGLYRQNYCGCVFSKREAKGDLS